MKREYFLTQEIGPKFLFSGGLTELEVYSINESLKIFDKLFSALPNSFINNVDLFYSAASALLHYDCDIDTVISVWKNSESPTNFLETVRDRRSSLTDKENHDLQLINTSISDFIALNDEELKRYARSSILINEQDLFSISGPNSIYAKVNHGYWEFMLNSFMPSANNLYRDLKVRNYPRTWLNTKFHNKAYNCFLNYFRSDVETRNKYFLAASLTAGQESVHQTLEKDFDSVSRGALVGLLSFIKATNTDSVTLYEGSLPRDVLRSQKLMLFLESITDKKDAILFITPPSLSGIHLSSFKGQSYQFIVPGQTVHESAAFVLSSLKFLLDQLLVEHKSILILNQSAVFSLLVADMINSKYSNDPHYNISFYDLGRVLDVVRPDLISKWPSLSWYVQTKEYKKLSRHFYIHTDKCNLLVSKLNFVKSKVNDFFKK